MRKLLCSFCGRVGSRLVRFGKSIHMTPMEKRVIPWRADRGDQTLRLEYNLSSDSVVFDVGGYEGQWTSDIFSRFCCNVHVFEPVPQFAEKIATRFRKNPKIVVHTFGLANCTMSADISLANDGSSTCNIKCAEKNILLLPIKLVNIKEFIEKHGIQRIDLMKVNIEGGEYDLLEYMLSSGLMASIGNLQVQFHDFVPDARMRMEKIQKGLTLTHMKTWSYEFVWENWHNQAFKTVEICG